MAVATKDQILDAAERLFAARGFEAASLRQLTAAAGVNLAAVHYHFGSKEGLIRAVFERRIGPLNEARLARLDALQARAAERGDPVELQELLEAVLEPPIAMAQKPGGRDFLALLGRMHAGAMPEVIQQMFVEQFTPVRDRLVPMLTAAAPGVPVEELLWRCHFTIGAMAHTLTSAHALEVLSEGRCRAGDSQADLRRLVTFCAAGMRAPLESPILEEPHA